MSLDDLPKPSCHLRVSTNAVYSNPSKYLHNIKHTTQSYHKMQLNSAFLQLYRIASQNLIYRLWRYRKWYKHLMHWFNLILNILTIRIIHFFFPFPYCFCISHAFFEREKMFTYLHKYYMKIGGKKLNFFKGCWCNMDIDSRVVYS